MMTISLELVITLTFIALVTLFFHRDLLSDSDTTPDRSVPLLPVDHPMRIRTRREFNELISRPRDTIIFVGAPWCGYCHSAVVHFMEAADGLGGTAFVLDVKGTELSRLVDEIGITAFPSVIKCDSHGVRTKYSGERTVAAFREYLTGEKKKTNETAFGVNGSPPVAPAGSDVPVEPVHPTDPVADRETHVYTTDGRVHAPAIANSPVGASVVTVRETTHPSATMEQKFEMVVLLRPIS